MLFVYMSLPAFRTNFPSSSIWFSKRLLLRRSTPSYLESIYKSIDSKNNIDIIYIDYEKTFDNVDHDILLTKLFNFGVRGKLIKLIAILSNRKDAKS